MEEWILLDSIYDDYLLVEQLSLLKDQTNLSNFTGEQLPGNVLKIL